MRQVGEEQEPESSEQDIERLSLHRRRTYLRGRYRWNQIRCQSPYNETPIHFKTDLMWIARKRGWRILALSQDGRWLARHGRALWSRLRREPARGDPPNLRGAVLKNIDLSGLDLSGANLEGATFTVGCQLVGTRLINADLRGARFEDVDLSGTIFLNDTQEATLRSYLPVTTASIPVGLRVPVSTRNELLWIVSRGYSPQLIDLRGADVYERDLDGLDLIPESVASPEAETLVGAIQQNLATDKPPFSDVIVGSWKDLLWLKLAVQAGVVSVDINPQKRLDLRNAKLSGGNFRGASLFKADLCEADLSQAVLDAADLTYARLSEADLSKAWVRGADLVHADLTRGRVFGTHLEGTNLSEANLHRARLDDAVLRGATLSVADLRAATFRSANLECVDLRGARVNAATSFIDARISAGTQWGDVVFHSTPLLEINWRSAKRLGDESILYAYRYLKRSRVRNRYYRDVMRAYRQMYAKLTDQGFYGPARKYRLREKALVRKQLWEYRRIHDWFNSWVAYLLIGYGEQPGKLFIPYFLVIGIWTLLYYALARRTLQFLPEYTPDQLTWFQAATLSLSTFRGQPSFPRDLLQQHYIGTFLPVLGAVETAIGTIILLAMTLLWTRRLFGNETPVVEGGSRSRIRRLLPNFRRSPARGALRQDPAQGTSQPPL
jgi:uncharacterized protein YjbI with pentapeptide repeats